MDARGGERHRRSQNRILRALPPDDFNRLLQRIALVQLSRGQVLADITTGYGSVYVMMSGASSAVLTTIAGDKVEVASISCEGVTSAIRSDPLGLDLQLIVTVDHASALRVSVAL